MKINRITVISITLLTSGLILSGGCSNSGGNTDSGGGKNNGDISKLQITSPKIIYSNTGTPGSGYVVINNSGSQVVQNISYHLTNFVGSGKNVAIDENSAANCAIIAGYSQCNIKLIVESGAVAGSFGFNVGNDTSLSTQLTKGSKASSSVTQVIGIEQSFYNNLSGADGVSLSYYQTVINGTSFVLVSGLVASANAGNFNDIVLVDGNGNMIPNQQLISEVSNYTQGSTFSILLPIPLGSNLSQTIKVQTRQIASDGSVTVISTAKSSGTLTTASNIGIADILPAAVYLTKIAPEQYITFSNTGDAIAQLQKLTVNNPNVEVVFDPVSLASGATATAVLKLKDSSGSISAGSMELTYNNAQSEASTIGVVTQNINPSPTPTPSPSPSPSLALAGLTVVANPNIFYTTTAVGTTSQQMTITNVGNTDENNMVITLPDDFTIANGSNPGTSCNVTQGVSPATISDTLAANGGSCNVTVIYTNSDIVNPAQTGTISVEYKYDNGTPAPTPATATVSYRVTQATANLSLSPNTSQTYSSIISNNSSVSTPIQYTLTNSGDETATNLAFNFAGTDGNLFHVISGGTCNSGGSLSSVSGNNSCSIDTQFGPAPNGSAGSKSGTFNVGYVGYVGSAATTTANVGLNGTVTAAPSASFNLQSTGVNFLSGTGSLGNPYQGYTSNAYTINAVYTNTANVVANNFTTSSFTTANGFSRTTHGCDGNQGAMAQNASCTDVYTLNDSATGAHNLNLANITASWTDSSGSYTNQTISGAGTVYTNLITQPVITITTPGFTNGGAVIQGGSFNILATLQGDGIATQTLTITNSAALNALGIIITQTPASCALQTQNQPYNTSCTFNLTMGWNITPANNYSVDIANSGSITPSQTNIPFSVIAPAVFLAKTGETGTTPSGCNIAGSDCVLQEGLAWSGSPRFVAGSGAEADCIIDNLTGLMWQKSSDNTSRTWSAALSYADGLSLCGHNDWRLPNINELNSLVNYGQANQKTWLENQGFSGLVNAGKYWSSSTAQTNGTAALYVIFNKGDIGTQAKTTGTDYTIAVRGNPSTTTTPQTTALIAQTGETATMSGYSVPAGGDGNPAVGVTWPSPRFVVGNGAEANCITDKLTGLMWSKDANLFGDLDWDSALTEISNINTSSSDPNYNLCGHTDWRLPNVNELRSLINYGIIDQGQANWLIAQGFTNPQENYYWTSSVDASNYTSNAWQVSFFLPLTTRVDDIGGYFPIWPVRSGQ